MMSYISARTLCRGLAVWLDCPLNWIERDAFFWANLSVLAGKSAVRSSDKGERIADALSYFLQARQGGMFYGAVQQLRSLLRAGERR